MLNDMYCFRTSTNLAQTMTSTTAAVFASLIGCILMSPQVPQPGSAPQSRLGEWTGRVETGMMAIGGETTGVRIVTAAGDEFELLAEGAVGTRLRELSGQQVTLRGRLDVRPGIELNVRRIITVTQIRRPTPWTERRAGDLIFVSFWRAEESQSVREKLGRLPAAVRDAYNGRLDRRRVYKTRDALPAAEPGSLLDSVRRNRLALESALVGLAGPGAAAEAASYVATARLSYEWEGFPDGPMDEAAFAADYVSQHPNSPLRPFLELFQLHRLRAAFEAAGFSAAFPPSDASAPVVAGFATAQRTAAERYRAIRQRLAESTDLVARAMADDIDAELYVYIDIAAHPRS